MFFIRSLFAMPETVIGEKSAFSKSIISPYCVRSLYNCIEVDFFHVLPPFTPTFGDLKARQSIIGSLLGRTIAQIRWSIETSYDYFGEIIGEINTNTDFTLLYSPVNPSYSYFMFEILDISPSIFQTTTDTDISLNNDVISVVNASGFSIDDIIRIGNTSGQYVFRRIKSINVNKITLYEKVNVSFLSGIDVELTSFIMKTEVSDYSIDISSGEINIILGNFTTGSFLYFLYRPVADFLSHYIIYKVPGNLPVVSDYNSGIYIDDVANYPGSELIVEDLDVSNNGYVDILNPIENGSDHTYYVFLSDEFNSVSYGMGHYFESIPSIPQLSELEIDDSSVRLNWDSYPVTDVNTDGFNIYRNEGLVFSEGDAVRINDTLISKLDVQFLDNSSNSNRVVSIEDPENGTYYTYKIEAEDTNTSWTIGTQNNVEGDTLIIEAEK